MPAPKIKWDVNEEDELKAFASNDDGKTWAEVPWYPQPGSQSLFCQTRIYEALYEGNRGPGKTDALLNSFAHHTGERITLDDGSQMRGWGAEWKGILFRQTFPQLKDIISKSRKWFPKIYPGIKFNASDYVWTWPTGETLRLSYIQKPDDYWNYHGHEYPWIGFEELTTWPTDECYTAMFSCSRSSQVGMPRMVRATTNPYGPGHNWVKARFRLPIPLKSSVAKIVKEEGQPDRVVIHGALKENKILLHADPNYIKNIVAAANGNKAKIAAWIDGDWDIVAGGMFDDVWDKDIHLVPRFEIPSSWSIYRSYDHGSSSPFSVGWWAVSDGSDYRDAKGLIRSSVRGDMFRIHEWYGWTGKPNEGLRMLSPDIAKGIIERELLNNIHHRVKAGPADGAIFAANDGVNIAIDMMKPQQVNSQLYRIKWIPSDKRPGSRKTGWELMRTMFRNAIPYEDGSVRDKPGIFVFDHCEQFIRTIPSLARDEKDPDDVNTDIEDHIADEARYMVRFGGSTTSSGWSTGLAG